MTMMRFFYALAGIFLTSSAFAIDPVAWKLDEPFPEKVLVSGGGVYVATYALQSQLPFTMVNPFIIQKKPSSDEFSFVDNCTGKKLKPKEICTFQIKLSPVSAGSKNVQIILSGYDKNQVPLPELKTEAQQNDGVSINASLVMPLPSSMTVNSAAVYEFEFMNTGTADATGVSVYSESIGFSSNCPKTLAAGASCQGSGTYTPFSTIPANQSVMATFNFAQGDPVSVSTTTMVTAETGLIGEVIEGLPNPTLINMDYPVHFRFTNQTANPVNINQSIAFPPQVYGVVNNCPDGGAPFNSMDSCDITAIFNANTTGPFAMQAQLIPVVTPPATATVITHTETILNTGNNRIINFVNNCNFPVWFSLNGANRQSNGANIPCASDDDCPLGSQCNPAANNNVGQCFWTNYWPREDRWPTADDKFRLAPAGGGVNSTNYVLIPDEGNLAGGIIWSGSISASTGCSGSACITADCGNEGGTEPCLPGVGFNQPATQAEITMQLGSADTYDVEVINGFHIPVQITPDGATANAYNCGSPGAPTAQNGFGACNWNMPVTPEYKYIRVTSGGNSCDTFCPGEICGLDQGMNQVCGKFLGFWTGNEACAINAYKAHNYYNCLNWLQSPFPAGKYQFSSLYACATPKANESLLNSCYRNGAQTDCCGCVNWQNLPGVALPATEVCKNTASVWNTWIQNTLLWMKQACPNYYTYPYDDKSATFTCSNGNPNTQAYTVTFCAGNTSGGLPAGAPDGRI